MLQKANKALSKHQYAKKIQLHNKGVLTKQKAEDILLQ